MAKKKPALAGRPQPQRSPSDKKKPGSLRLRKLNHGENIFPAIPFRTYRRERQGPLPTYLRANGRQDKDFSAKGGKASQAQNAARKNGRKTKTAGKDSPPRRARGGAFWAKKSPAACPQSKSRKKNSGSDGAGAVRRRWLPGSELAWPAKRERAPYGSEPTCTDGKKKSALTQRPSPTKKTRRKKSPAATYFRATKALSSAQESLTSVFGMGTGIASPPWPPDNNNQIITSNNEGKKREDGGRQKRPG